MARPTLELVLSLDELRPRFSDRGKRVSLDEPRPRFSDRGKRGLEDNVMKL